MPDYGRRSGGGWFQLSSNDPLPGSNVVRVRVGADTLEFDLRGGRRGVLSLTQPERNAVGGFGADDLLERVGRGGEEVTV